MLTTKTREPDAAADLIQACKDALCLISAEIDGAEIVGREKFLRLLEERLHAAINKADPYTNWRN